MIQLAVAALTATALALAPGEQLTLELVGDVVVAGTFRDTDGQSVVLNVDGSPLRIELSLVEQASRDGLPLAPDVLRAEAQAWSDTRVDPGRALHPALVGTASALWPGSGHLLLGEWRKWAGYALIDGSLLALGSWYAIREQAPKAAAALLGLDMVFRVYAVREAVRDAQRRRPASQTRLNQRLDRCDRAFTLVPLPGGGVTAAAGVRCGGFPRLDPRGPIH